MSARGATTAELLFFLAAVYFGGGAPAPAAVTQRGGLRVSVGGELSPRSLPRRGEAPISVAVASRIASTDGSEPPELRRLRIEINRHGRLQTGGLPVCPYRAILTATSIQARKLCGGALVGRGSFEANVSLPSQPAYPAKATLLVFNGRRKGKPVLLGQVYSPRPFATSFVIVFRIGERRRGAFGTVLEATMPRSLGGWGVVTGVDLRLSRRYRSRGSRRSFLAAGCPAPAGFGSAVFPLARIGFRFAGGVRMSTAVTQTCRVSRP